MSEIINEAPRRTPVHDTCDVLVAGGGPAGVAAALSAARRSATVILLENQGCLGGIWTSGALSWILDHDNKRGLMAEVLARLQERGWRAIRADGLPTNAYDVEGMKLLLEEMCLADKVRVRLHTRVVAGLCDENGRLSHVVTESKAGREAWAAQVFIDATGDGNLAARVGCSYAIGHPETGRTQPLSLMALLSGLHAAEVHDFINGEGDQWGVPQARLKAAFEKGGLSPSYAVPTLFRIHDDLFALMANHQYDVACDDADAITQATIEARRELHQLIDALRRSERAFANVRIVATGAQIGVREGRRIRGLYEVTKEDLIGGAHFPDAICPVTFPVDIHATNPRKEKGIESSSVKAQPYDIPLRALIARDVEGLLMAGRCISGDFWAHASYRVTGNAVTMGEAAGAFAAHCAQNNLAPRETGGDLAALSDFVQHKLYAIPESANAGYGPAYH